MNPPHLLMCRPSGLYEVSKILHDRVFDESFNPTRAAAQWENLYGLLSKTLKLPVELLEGPPDSPGLALAGDAGIVVKKVYLRSRFRSPSRRLGETSFAKWFQNKGFLMKSLEPPFSFEVHADAVTADRVLYAAIRSRGDDEHYDAVSAVLKIPYFPLNLACARVRLDSCLNAFGSGTALFYPGAFDVCSRMFLRENFENAIVVSKKEALRGVCAAIAVGKDILLPEGCPSAAKRLTRLGYRIHEFDGSEWLKLGFGLSSLVFKI